jgi:hypothetical protein
VCEDNHHLTPPLHLILVKQGFKNVSFNSKDKN